MKIRVSNNQKTPIDIKNIKSLVKYTFEQEGINQAGIEISVLLENNKGITDINKKYLGRSRSTDVISFRLWEGPFTKVHPEIFGDIVVNVQEAKKRGSYFARELALYVIHGVLHLLGYIDDTKTNAARMQKRCNAILKGWL
jgi:probable rRNA maturation factor